MSQLIIISLRQSKGENQKKVSSDRYVTMWENFSVTFLSKYLFRVLETYLHVFVLSTFTSYSIFMRKFVELADFQSFLSIRLFFECNIFIKAFIEWCTDFIPSYLVTILSNHSRSFKYWNFDLFSFSMPMSNFISWY